MAVLAVESHDGRRTASKIVCTASRRAHACEMRIGGEKPAAESIPGRKSVGRQAHAAVEKCPLRLVEVASLKRSITDSTGRRRSILGRLYRRTPIDKSNNFADAATTRPSAARVPIGRRKPDPQTLHCRQYRRHKLRIINRLHHRSRPSDLRNPSMTSIHLSRIHSTWPARLSTGLGWLVVFLFVLGCRPIDEASSGAADREPTAAPERIVSLAPSITETLFALGVGDRVVGVTDYCEFPPEAKNLPTVGGYLTPNLEAIVALEPDLVVAPKGEQSPAEAVARLGLPVLIVENRSVDGVLETFEILGKRLGVPERGRALRRRCETQMRAIARRVEGLQRPRVLITVDRTVDGDRLQDVYAAAQDGYLDHLCTLAGGRNVCRAAARFPIISAEGILAMNPEVVFDLVGKVAPRSDDTTEQANKRREALLAAWRRLDQVEAVRNGRVYLVGPDVTVVPGPRFNQLLEFMARRIHPEIDWDATPIETPSAATSAPSSSVR
ncbi:MAG: ABC transporter substrate-binding protein [Planctomycetota bacterium]|nr:MAG: ABC transporter substrate-binding protein [Planctomycetota bacterium]